MRIRGRTTGADAIVRKLTRASQIVQESSSRQLKILGMETAEGSKTRTPEKTGKLVDSTRVSFDRKGRYIVTVAVTVGPVYDEKGEEYSLTMHEGFASLKNPEDWPYKLGEWSEDKNKGTEHRGIGVGYKFLERAYAAVLRNARNMIKNGVWKDLKIGMLR